METVRVRLERRRQVLLSVVTGLLAGGAFLTGSEAARGAVTATSDPGAVAAAMTPQSDVLAGAEFEVAPPQALSAGAATDAIGGFPTDGNSYAVLSTGDVANVQLANSNGNTGTALGGDSVRGGAERDVTVLRLDIDVPTGANCLTNMDFRFLSEEYPEYVGSNFNDAFIAEVDTSTWETTGNAITAERNFAFDPVGNPITVNAAGVTSMTAGEADGTTFDGATPLLSAATPITPGKHKIYLTVFDLGDQWFDSMVLIDNLRFGKVANVSRDCKPGAQIVDDRKYVALGDSYSSGFGVEPYFAGTHGDTGDNNCQRSKGAYSATVKSFYELNLNFHACQGAVTKDFYSPRNSTWGEVAQLDHLDRETGLVTFSIGGNDAKFADVLAECILGAELLPFNTCHNDDKVTRPVAEAMSRLAGQASTPADVKPYDSLFKDVRSRAPYSTRVAVGYPEFFPEDGGDRTSLPGGRCEGVKKADQRWMVEQIRKLNGIIKSAAQRNGFRFANPSSRFNGHQLCSGGDEWISGLLSSGRFHPTGPGQDAIGDAVLERLADDSAEGPAYTVQKNETVKGSFFVPVGQAVLSVVAQWPGSDVPLTLVSPSGVRYTREAPGPGVAHSAGETWEQFEIANPEPGQWQTELFGKDVGPGGEIATVLSTTEPAPNVAPTARIGFVDNGDGTLTFASTQSVDPDGQITRREWYVANSPDDEVRSDGETVTVPVDTRNKNVTLVITDDRGETAFASVGVPGVDPPAQPPVLNGGSGPDPGTRLEPTRDIIAPKITKLSVQRAVRRGRKTTWRSTRSLSGRVRVSMRLSEPATVTVTLASVRNPKKVRTVKVKARAGAVTIDLRRLVRGLPRGKALLSVAAVDASKNAAKKRLTVSR